jgi:hypothetical protein
MTDETTSRLAKALEGVSELSITKIREILELPVGTPIDEDAGRLLRAHISAAAVALNTQLRADALKLRAARDDMALERLIATIRLKEGSVPCLSAARDT